MKADRSRIGVFLDRDGTISEEVGYVDNIEKFSLYDFSASAIRNLNNLGVKIIVITNQACVAKGVCSEKTVNLIHTKMVDILKKEGACVDAIYYCPHHLEGIIDEYKIDCSCRKPNPGMVLEAAKKFNIELGSSFIIGDKVSDIETGYNAGIKTIIVMTGQGREELKKINENNLKKPHFIAEDLLEASELICEKIYEFEGK